MVGETIFGGLKLSISTIILGEGPKLSKTLEHHCGFGGWKFQTSKIAPNPPNHTSNCLICQNNLFFVHLSHSGPFQTFPAEISEEGSNWPPPPKLGQLLEHKIFCIHNHISKMSNRVHHAPGVEIQYLTCLSLNF